MSETIDEKDKRERGKRENYTRCRFCKQLFYQGDIQLDPIKGYICKRNCQNRLGSTYEQPPYESPLHDD